MVQFHLPLQLKIIMEEEKIKNYLKEHLRIDVYNHYENYRVYLGVRILIDDEEIDASVNYDIEL